MSSREAYPKRLIEVDLPIKRISADARREKSIRHGHISTLHIWWARGFVLEYDDARKIAQGLGAHLEQLTSLIEVKGTSARLLPVAERTRSLFQKTNAA